MTCPGGATTGCSRRATRATTDGVWTGSVWECPQAVRVGEKWALLVSVWEPVRPHYEAYALGDIVDGRFVAQTPWRRLTYGPSYYAGAVYRDKDGRPGMVHWLRHVSDLGAGWAGAHSLPHQLRARRGPCSRSDSRSS